MKTCIILQARMNSSRLPGKIALQLNGKPILEHVIARLKKFSRADQLIVATTRNSIDDITSKIGINQHVPVFRGSEENVLERYYQCATTYGAEQIIRATADDPLTSVDLLEKMFDSHIKQKADYTCSFGYPIGVQEEIVTFDALRRCYELSSKPNHFEHVLEYIPEHPWAFNINIVKAQGKVRRPDVRVTLDTVEDFQVLQSYVSYFDDIENISIPDIIDFWDRTWKIVKTL